MLWPAVGHAKVITPCSEAVPQIVTAGLTTCTGTEAETPLIVAVTTVEPADAAETTPVPETRATDGFADANESRSRDMSRAPKLSSADSFSVSVSRTVNEMMRASH